MTSAPEELKDWLTLAAVPGIGALTLRRLLGGLGLPGAVLAAPRGELLKHLTERQCAALKECQADEAVQERVAVALEWAQAPGNRLMTLADADYPRALLEVADPPPLIYLKGRVELLARPAVAIVGSRNATAQGLANADAFATALSDAGYTVVSGQALGIDTAAHRGALRSGAGSTIAVIGTGIDIVYPSRNRDLAHRIAEVGLIVSEFPLGSPALAANFPRRNRIISGLARGVVVVEAALRSGSLITAREAAEQGREVFAIPGSIHSPLAKGCHLLIKQGAKLVESAADILDELGSAPPQATEEAPEEAQPDGFLTALGYDPVAIDMLPTRSGLTMAEVSAKLMQLELNGQVQLLPGGRVQRMGR